MQRVGLRAVAAAIVVLLPCVTLAQNRSKDEYTRYELLAPETAGASDLDTAARIRRSLVSDDSLSTDAKAVSVSVENGNVTLTGTVRSSYERDVVTGKAAAAVGKNHVQTNLQLVTATP